MKKILFLAILTLLCSLSYAAPAASSDQNPMAYLEATFPKLAAEYKADLDQAKAHYIFAIDVSGTMKRFEPYVVPSIKAFFNALPDGDRVTVIPFGTEILDLPGYKGVVSTDMRKNLVARAEDLYSNSNLTKEFKQHTDVKKAIDAVANAVRNNRDYKINILIVMTDFRNDVPGDNERPLNKEELEDLYANFTAATMDLYARNIALELPYIDAKGNMSAEKNHAMKGYCLKQLKSSVFPQEGEGKLQVVPIDNSEEGINQWFTQLQREIMVTKLRGVIANENKVAPATVEPEVNIDGKVSIKVEWTPTRLYPNLRIDSSYFETKNWIFNNNPESWQTTTDRTIEVDLGQIKNAELGFHNITDSLKLGLSLPTNYDEELALLNIQKPIPDTKFLQSRWLFTFYLPFWLCCVIAVITIWYILNVIKAIKRNAALMLKCKVSVTDRTTGEKTVLMSKPVPNLTSLAIGGSNNGCQKHLSVPGASWAVSVKKVKGNPFLLKKPYFKWKSEKNYVFIKGPHIEGKIGTGPNALYAGTKTKVQEATHKIEIQRLS